MAKANKRRFRMAEPLLIVAPAPRWTGATGVPPKLFAAGADKACMRTYSVRLLSAVAVLAAGVLFAQEGVRRVTKTEGINNATSKAQPDYPPMARQLKIEGAVELEALVNEAGAVEKVNIVSGNPVLTGPAAEAIRKWKFTPFFWDGKAVKALVPVGLTFKL